MESSGMSTVTSKRRYWSYPEMNVVPLKDGKAQLVVNGRTVTVNLGEAEAVAKRKLVNYEGVEEVKKAKFVETEKLPKLIPMGEREVNLGQVSQVGSFVEEKVVEESEDSRSVDEALEEIDWGLFEEVTGGDKEKEKVPVNLSLISEVEGLNSLGDVELHEELRSVGIEKAIKKVGENMERFKKKEEVYGKDFTEPVVYLIEMLDVIGGKVENSGLITRIYNILKQVMLVGNVDCIERFLRLCNYTKVIKKRMLEDAHLHKVVKTGISTLTKIWGEEYVKMWYSVNERWLGELIKAAGMAEGKKSTSD